MDLDITKRKITVNIDAARAKKFKVKCVENGETMSEVLERLMKLYILKS